VETTTVKPPARRQRLLIAAIAVIVLVLVAAVALAVVALTRNSTMSRRIDRLSTQLAHERSTTARLRSQLTQQNGASAQEVQALQASVKKLQARLKLYDNCVPEIMGQINSLSANVQSTGPLYITPSQSVSHFCQPILFGSATPGG
jgi:uncharacterized protein HemX